MISFVNYSHSFIYGFTDDVVFCNTVGLLHHHMLDIILRGTDGRINFLQIHLDFSVPPSLGSIGRSFS